uniref:Response regulatory domain-containing protein n=1 Tax=Oryza glumipatula TaxID=40148 RepID=A0A0D9ZL65_9ORYZ
MEGGRGVTRVLLVDDSPVDRRVVQLLLSSSACAGSFHVIAVDSAKKAMEFLGLKEEGKVKKKKKSLC